MRTRGRNAQRGAVRLRRGHTADVVVVGAGVSGLTAALRLHERGRSVVVLEARDRVGGRTFSPVVAGERLDLGGQWIGPTQRRVRALLDELGIRTRPQYDEGKHLLRAAGKLRAYQGTIPRIGPVALVDLRRALGLLDRMARSLDPARPWAAEDARTWDGLTLQAWTQRFVRTAAARAVLHAAVRSILCCEPSEVSLLYVLFYARSAGGLMQLAEVEGGAQQDRIAGGAQQICERLAERLGGHVRLGEPVAGIEQDERGVTVRTAWGQSVRARRAIVAVAPALAGRIAYAPALPALRDQLCQRMPQGSSLKFVALYDRAFWRDAGYSGLVVDDDGPVHLVFDDGAATDAYAVLVGFVLGRHARRLGAEPQDARRRTVLDALAGYFGEQANDVRGYADLDWNAEPWTRGCPVAVAPAGALTGCGEALREPCGRIHWAGTETATEWAGFIDGAIGAAERVANEIAARDD